MVTVRPFCKSYLVSAHLSSHGPGLVPRGLRVGAGFGKRVLVSLGVAPDSLRQMRPCRASCGPQGLVEPSGGRRQPHCPEPTWRRRTQLPASPTPPGRCRLGSGRHGLLRAEHGVEVSARQGSNVPGASRREGLEMTRHRKASIRGRTASADSGRRQSGGAGQSGRGEDRGLPPPEHLFSVAGCTVTCL